MDQSEKSSFLEQQLTEEVGFNCLYCNHPMVIKPFTAEAAANEADYLLESVSRRITIEVTHEGCAVESKNPTFEIELSLDQTSDKLIIRTIIDDEKTKPDGALFGGEEELNINDLFGTNELAKLRLPRPALPPPAAAPQGPVTSMGILIPGIQQAAAAPTTRSAPPTPLPPIPAPPAARPLVSAAAQGKTLVPGAATAPAPRPSAPSIPRPMPAAMPEGGERTQLSPLGARRELERGPTAAAMPAVPATPAPRTPVAIAPIADQIEPPKSEEIRLLTNSNRPPALSQKQNIAFAISATIVIAIAGATGLIMRQQTGTGENRPAATAPADSQKAAQTIPEPATNPPQAPRRIHKIVCRSIKNAKPDCKLKGRALEIAGAVQGDIINGLQFSVKTDEGDCAVAIQGSPAQLRNARGYDCELKK